MISFRCKLPAKHDLNDLFHPFCLLEQKLVTRENLINLGVLTDNTSTAGQVLIGENTITTISANGVSQ